MEAAEAALGGSKGVPVMSTSCPARPILVAGPPLARCPVWITSSIRTCTGNRNYWSKYDWPEAGDEWSKPWGGSENMWYCGLFPLPLVPSDRAHPESRGLRARDELPPQVLRAHRHRGPRAQCIEACRQRFAGDNHIGYHVNDGHARWR